MINVQIRGNLINVKLKSISKYNFYKLINEVYDYSYIKSFMYDSSNCKTIFNSAFPIIEQNSELQVTSFEDNNYYHDGYTFFRSSLNEIEREDQSLEILLNEKFRNYLLISIGHGYGTAFETELMDINYQNFENEKLKCNSIKLFGNEKTLMKNIKLNHLSLQDLKRNKYEIINEQIIFFKSKAGNKSAFLSGSLEYQGDVISVVRNNIRDNRN